MWIPHWTQLAAIAAACQELQKCGCKKTCSGNYIRVFNQRTQLESINKQHGKFTIMISKKHEKEYFERIKCDLLLGKMNQCFYNTQMNVDRKSCDSIHSPLTAACKGGNEKIVQLLLDKGSDVNQVDIGGYTPLTSACIRGNEKIVQLLIDKGSDVNQVETSGYTPLTAACSEEKEMRR
ncbi:unnamed protein product [Mytilus edulis]|uniref:Uncharacterized protein n=1 Tax=Mytilus edulis TaxID=6550 RepID=A0A8S3T7F0_MYTED|nr:unnamed protein product [Mytilus edulis]